MGDLRTQKLTIGGAGDKAAEVLGCVGWPNATGGMDLRIFFGAGTDPAGFVGHETPDLRLSDIRTVNEAPVITATALSVTDTVEIPHGDRVLSVQVSRPETELFAGLDVAILELNGEPLSDLAQWLDYHGKLHGVQGVVMLDRWAPDVNSGRDNKIEQIARRCGMQAMLHLKSSIPLGQPGLPPAQHPFNAPDAPGKDRMMGLDPAPRRSPLGQLSIYEFLKWGYLSRAAGVMNIDLSDYLTGNVNPFERVRQSPVGAIRLVGRRVYPWRIKQDQAPGIGDHSCAPFDVKSVNRRWCIAPAKLPSERVWRYIRIADTEFDEAEDLPFYRAMSLRHPDAKIAQIVPKSSLVEDETLMTWTKRHFNADPVRAPKSKAKLTDAAAEDDRRTCIITCMKNEGPYILEWLAYHRAIGVDDFLIYTNDCSDGTETMLNTLQAHGIVQRRDNPFEKLKLKPQHAALKVAEKEDVVRRAGWAVSMDVDEFINIHCGEGRLDDLFDAVGDANLISMTWRLFGNGDRVAFEDKPVIEQFTACAPELIRKPHQAWGFKTLFRNIGIYKKFGVHRPKGLKPDLWEDIHWVNGSGQPMPKTMLRNGWRSTVTTYGYDLVTLNHYAVRSVDGFLVKRDRGRVNHVDRDQGLSYWFRMNNNAETDETILSKLGPTQEELASLKALPGVAEAHQRSVDWHKERVEALKSRPDFQALFDSLTSQRMRRLSRLHHHFGANVFLAGPEVVPDKVVLDENLAPDFFFTVQRQDTSH